MSDADKTQAKPAASNVLPEACRGCTGLQPRPKLPDVEDMDKLAVEALIKKASHAQQMFTHLMNQLIELHECNESDYYI